MSHPCGGGWRSPRYPSAVTLMSTTGSTSTSATETDAAWISAWEKEVAGIDYLEDYFDSAAQLRGILQRGLLKFTDLRDVPARFFEAHRQIAARSTELGPGFFIRFTVQVGTVCRLPCFVHDGDEGWHVLVLVPVCMC